MDQRLPLTCSWAGMSEQMAAPAPHRQCLALIGPSEHEIALVGHLDSSRKRVPQLAQYNRIYEEGHSPCCKTDEF